MADPRRVDPPATAGGSLQPLAVDAEPWQLLVLSARSETALDRAAANLASHIAAHPTLNLADAAFTLQVGRVFTHGRFAVVRDAADAVAALGDPARLGGGARDRQSASVAFLFTGQGAQYVGMGRGTHESEPAFRDAQGIRAYWDVPPIEILGVGVSVDAGWCS